MSVSKYVDQISDEFNSTFAAVGENTLVNCLGFKDDFVEVERIIKNYLPEAKVEFTKLKDLSTPTVPNYGVYRIEVTT